jgi:Outer membrane lipoprotein carrier protein LolA-like
MISGSHLLLTALLSASPPPAADDIATTALIGRLARPAPATTPYAEVRFVHLLRKPIVLHGELDYGGADHLGKRVDTPYRETTTISGTGVKVEREGHEPREFALEHAPQLQALLASFSALLGGDAATLRKYYSVGLVENAKKWTLTLTPQDSSLARHLRNIVVDGNEGEPRCFAMTEANGDASIMLIGALAKTQLPDPPTPAALTTLCRAAP